MKYTHKILPFAILCCILYGCGADINEPESAEIVQISPKDGSEITPTTTITIAFDSPPINPASNIGILTIHDRNISITGPFLHGQMNLIIKWENGLAAFIYTVNSL